MKKVIQKEKRDRWKAGLWLLLFIAFVKISTAQPSARAVKYAEDRTYRISQKSVLKLDGKTNVNAFSCDCNDQFPPKVFTVEKDDENPSVIKFSDASLHLDIKSLDCGNKLMNKDLQKALHADKYPDIRIQLLKITSDKCNRLTELRDWVKVKALVKISLNGQSHDYWLDVNAKKMSDAQFRFIGVKSLCMTDFGVTPPVALLGAVKVRDEIKINLDLEVVVE